MSKSAFGYSPDDLSSLGASRSQDDDIAVQEYDENGSPIEDDGNDPPSEEDLDDHSAGQGGEQHLGDEIDDEDEIDDGEGEGAEEGIVDDEETQNAQALAESFLSKGAIPADTDLESITSYDQVEEMVANHLLSTKGADFEAEAYRRIREEEGVTDEAIEIAKRISAGVQPEKVTRLQTLRTYARADIGSLTDDQVKYYLRDSYIVAGSAPEDAERLAALDMSLSAEEKVAKLEARKEVFQQTEIAEENRQVAIQNEQVENRKRERRQMIDGIENALSSGELLTRNITPQEASAVRSAFLTRTETVELPNGKQAVVSFWDTIVRESDNNPKLLAELVYAGLVAKGRLKPMDTFVNKNRPARRSRSYAGASKSGRKPSRDESHLGEEI